MKIFGFEIVRANSVKKALSSVDPGSGGWYRILESWAGAWQSNVEIDYTTVLSNPTDFACRTLIASDIAKMRIKLVARSAAGVWSETQNPAYSPVLRKPNHFQTRIQFVEGWVLSKLQRGNAYILKQRDMRGVVVRLYVLDPRYVRVLVADNGDVFYELWADKLSGVETRVTVPAREIIHDRFNCMFHPLVGVSPIFAAGLSATHGLAIQEQATKFFQNGSRPGGILTAPGAISDETAARLKENWQTNFSGSNAGKVAVLGDGLKYEAMAMTAEASQLIEQLQWTGPVICSAYHVPPYKIGIGQMPSYNNVQALNVEYYSQALQILIESIELCLDEGLGLTRDDLGTEFDLDGLLRMDSVAQMDMLEKGKNTFAPNEARRRIDLPPVPGGDSVYRQQQDFSLEALAKRDAKDDPFGKSADASTSSTSAEPDAAANDNGTVRELAAKLMRNADASYRSSAS